MDDQHEHAGEREQHEDRGLALRPQAGDPDDRRDGEEEYPRRDAHDAVVRAGGLVILGAIVVAPTDHRGSGHRALRADVAAVVRCASRSGPAR